MLQAFSEVSFITFNESRPSVIFLSFSGLFALYIDSILFGIVSFQQNFFV